MKITSSTNPRIKELVKLREAKARRERGLTIVDGIREVSRAVEAGAAVKELYVCPELYEGQGQGNVAEVITKVSSRKIPVYDISSEIFQKVAFGERAEGVLAVCQPKLSTLGDIKKKKDCLLMIVEAVEKPGNLGAILRTCDAAGVDALLVSGHSTDIFNPNVIRASLGTVFTVPVVQADPKDIVTFLKKNQVKIFATTPDTSKISTKSDLRGSVAIIVGSEKEGLSGFWLDHADVKISIPMKGKADSLNAAVTAAVVAYEAVRQRT